MTKWIGILLVCLAAAAGCGDDDGTTEDAGTTADAAATEDGG